MTLEEDSIPGSLPINIGSVYNKNKINVPKIKTNWESFLSKCISFLTICAEKNAAKNREPVAKAFPR
ncbi:MAG: hypothetical protein V4467_01965 [Patescibacteria group bacterium]